MSKTITIVKFIFSNMNYSFETSIHNAMSLNYIRTLLEYNINGLMTTNIKIKYNKYIIFIDSSFYHDISISTVKELKNMLDNGIFEIYKLDLHKKICEQLKKLITNFSGINSEIILNSDIFNV